MICKNCSAEYDDKLEACPVCKEEEKENQPQTDDKETEKTAVKEASDNQEAEEEKNDAEDIGVENKTDKKKEKSPVMQKKRQRKPNPEAVKAQKRASRLIIILMCLVAALAVAVTVISITTDIFESEAAGEKVVAGAGFTSQEEKELEVLLAKSFSVLRSGNGLEKASAEDFLSNIKPGDSGNVYSRLNEVNETLQTQPDPAERFADENGAYAYYKLEESKVDKVLELFSLKSHRGENCEKYYYCDGFYYFAAEESNTTPEVNAEIVKSRRVLDGSCYVEGYFYVVKSGETVKTDNCHFVVEAEKDELTGERDFVIKKVSKEPIFGSDGKLVGDANYTENKTEVIEGYTDDGKLVCVYTLEFPVVEGSSQAYSSVNDFFKNAVSVYELKAGSAQQIYKEFIQNDGDESKLPFVENVIADIVFEDEKNLSFVAEISSFSSAAGEDEKNSTSGIYKRSVEAYTFDKSSGDFVSKDDVLGKNYMLIGEILYRIYNGYEYENILPKENEEEESESYDGVPSDTEGLGARIYESSWSYTERGVTFYYLTEKGYVTEITIPFDTVERLK